MNGVLMIDSIFKSSTTLFFVDLNKDNTTEGDVPAITVAKISIAEIALIWNMKYNPNDRMTEKRKIENSVTLIDCVENASNSFKGRFEQESKTIIAKANNPTLVTKIGGREISGCPL